MADQANIQYGSRGPRELRTSRREGDLLTEDLERMNPDGTVTKTITTTDEKTGQSHVSVYRMDKSGIVRKMDDADLRKQDLLKELKTQLAETKEKVEELKELQRRENTSVAYESGEAYNKNGIPYTKRVEEETPDKWDMAYSMRNINTPIKLTPKQQAIIREHKQNILNYGTQKLIKQLNKKLSGDKFNEAYPLSDEQKDKVIEFGVRKLQRLLEKNLDEERLVYDVMSFYPNFGKVDLSGRGTRQIPGDQSVSFKLDPYRNITPEEIAKPVSFSMRPEKPTKSVSVPDKSTGEKVVTNKYKGLWDRIMNPQSITESDTDTRNRDQSPKDEIYDSNNEKYDSDWKQNYTDENKNDKNDFNNIKDTVKQLMENNKLYKKARLSPEQKEGIVDYAFKQIRSLLKDYSEPEETKKSSRKEKIDLSEYFDEDEIFEYGKRALKKLVRRSLKGFDLDQDILRKDNVDDPELSARRDAFYQYLGDVVEGRVKESDPLPVPEYVKETEREDDSEEDSTNSVMSNLFGKKDKSRCLSPEKKPKAQQNKLSLDNLFSWLQSEKENKSDTEKVTPQPTESIPKVKPRFYQLEPETQSSNEQTQSVNENTRFDLKALLKQIQQAAVKKFSDTKPTESIESNNKETYQVQPQASPNSHLDSHERDLKPSDVDAALSRIRQSNENSNPRRVNPFNKPPYLKERISGLNTIPAHPKISTGSPLDRKADFSDQISFQLKPHSYDDNKEGVTSGSSENQRNETVKRCSHEQDFQPWWFESPDSFLKKTLSEKPLMKGGYLDPPMVDSSFSAGNLLD